MQQETNRDTAVREVLIEAVEVQLAALRAAMTFWGDWIERTSVFVNSATRDLAAVRSAEKNTGQVLLEIVDTGRESMRMLTELPRNAAAQFVRELDAISAKGQAAKGAAPRPRAAGTGRAPSPPRTRRPAKRRVRAKA